MRIDEVRNAALGAEREGTGQALVIKRRLAELLECVEQIGLLSELTPLSRQLERSDDDVGVRRRIAAKINRSETARTEVGTNLKLTETVRPLLG
jgi:hypothetical protein